MTLTVTVEELKAYESAVFQWHAKKFGAQADAIMRVRADPRGDHTRTR